MKLLALGFSVLLPVLALSNTVEENIEEAKERFKSPQGQIECKFPRLKPIGSAREGKTFSTRFRLKDFEFDVNYPSKRRSKPTLVGINKNISIDAYKKGSFFYFNFDQATENEKKIIRSYGLGNTKTGYNNIVCRTRFERDKHIEIGGKKTHINMHPHAEYDRAGNTVPSAQKYIDNPKYESIVLLENPGRSKFYNLWDVDDVQVNPTLDSKILTAPSGKALFSLSSDDIDVTYTGGYLNFCILNNTRSLLQSFLQQSNGGKLTINFDAQGLGAQPSSFKGNEAMSLPRFMYIKRFFERDPGLAKNFKNAQFAYYLRWVNNTKSMFKTVKYIYKSEGVNKVQTIQGSGDRNYEVIVKYINE